MTTSPLSIAQIAEKKAQLQAQLQQLDAQETQQRTQAAEAAHAQVLALLQQHGLYFTAEQRSHLAALLGSPAKPAAKRRADAAPKYQLPHTGETWTGRGRTPKAFAAWQETVAYKEWKADHPALKFPLCRP